MAFVYSIDEFGNIHTDDVTHITSNRGDGIIWRHAHEIFDDHIHTTLLSSGLYMVMLQEIVHDADSIYCSVATYFSDRTIIKDVVLVRALVSNFEALLCKYVTSIGGHIYLSNVLNIRDILTLGSMINYLKEVLQVTHTEHSSSKIYLDAINKIQDTIISHPILPNTNKIITSDQLQKLHTLISKSEIFRLYDTQFNHPITYAIHQIQTIDDLILNPLIKFFDAIVTSDVVMIAKDIIKRIHNTATATKQKLTNAITIRRQL